jgi:hypothetical protein
MYDPAQPLANPDIAIPEQLLNTQFSMSALSVTLVGIFHPGKVVGCATISIALLTL